MQKKDDCDYFAWADQEMTAYETKVMERFKVLDDRRQADRDRLEKLIETKYNDHYLKLEKLIETKYNDQYVKLRRELGLYQTNGKMFQATIVVVILFLVFLP